MENQDNLITNRTQKQQVCTKESGHSSLIAQKNCTNSSEIVESSESEDGFGALFWLLFCSTLMFTLPFGSFFYIKDYLAKHYAMDRFQTNCYSVLGAVITVNLIICLYVYKGFQEFDNMKKDNEKDSEKE